MVSGANSTRFAAMSWNVETRLSLISAGLFRQTKGAQVSQTTVHSCQRVNPTGGLYTGRIGREYPGGRMWGD
jgi:hypothetical protein